MDVRIALLQSIAAGYHRLTAFLLQNDVLISCRKFENETGHIEQCVRSAIMHRDVPVIGFLKSRYESVWRQAVFPVVTDKKRGRNEDDESEEEEESVRRVCAKNTSADDEMDID